MGSDLCCWLASCGASVGQCWLSSQGLQYIPLQSLQVEIKAILVGPCGPRTPLLLLLVVVGMLYLSSLPALMSIIPPQLPALQALDSGILPRSSNLTWTVSGHIAAVNVDGTGPDGSALVEP